MIFVPFPLAITRKLYMYLRIHPSEGLDKTRVRRVLCSSDTDRQTRRKCKKERTTVGGIHES